MGNFLDAQGSYLRSQWSNMAEIWTRSRFYARPRYLQVYKGSNQKQPRKGGDIVFPIISQWGLSVAMDTRVLIQSASKHYAAFPHPKWCYTQNLIKIGQHASEIFKFESVDDGRRWMDEGPLVYYKLTL